MIRTVFCALALLLLMGNAGSPEPGRTRKGEQILVQGEVDGQPQAAQVTVPVSGEKFENRRTAESANHPRERAPVAAFFLEGLKRLGYRGRLLDAAGRAERRHVAMLRPRDLLVAISFGKTCPLAEFIPIARERRVRVLGITDSPASPVTRDSDLNLPLRTDTRHAFQPLAPYFVLVQVLLMALEDKRSR